MNDYKIENKRKITVVVPTYNRPACISYLVEHCYSKYSGNLFCFEIHDSSSDDSTKKILDEACLGENFRYFHYDPELNGDVKTMRAISNVSTPYMYLMGDGIVMDFNALEEWLLAIDFEKYSIIGIRENTIHKYSQRSVAAQCSTQNKQQFFNDYFWMLTLYGASIISREIAQTAFKMSEKYKSLPPFMYICSVFCALEKVGGPCYFSFLPFFEFNPNKKSVGWIASRQAIEFFCYIYYESMRLLPECYNAMDSKFLKKHNDLSGLFRLKSVLKMRVTGNLTYKLFRKYKFYIKKTVPHMSYIYFALLIPAFVMRGVYKIYLRLFKKRETA